jgi:ABC-2 type transport system permease protein
MRSIGIIFRRELASYFATPLAYIFIVIFLVLAGALAFFLGNFFERGQADLQAFFTFHPWLYLVLIPALSMLLWAEERKSGTIELFLTLPISMAAAVIGKFLAAWIFAGIALALTFPFWLTVNYLGAPDNGVILASYLGSFLMAGAFLAIGACLSALTKNQVIAFVLGAAACFFFLMSGLNMVLAAFRGWTPQIVVDTRASFSFLTHFTSIIKGVIDLRDAVFFASVIGVFLMANVILVELKKAD